MRAYRRKYFLRHARNITTQVALYLLPSLEAVNFHLSTTTPHSINMQIGEQVPELLGIDQNGQEVRMSQYAGRKVILYFYPKDQTPGCTAEACSLRDNYSDLTSLGYDVIGVSADSVESHQKFIEAHHLPFRLIADTDKTLINAMGVWGEKNRYGRITVGLLRTTFLIDETGKVESIFTPGQIRTKEHAAQIMKRVKG